MCSTLSRVASDTELVSIWVSEVGAIVVLVVLGPQTGQAFGCAAMRECSLVRAVYERAIACEERNHLSIPGIVRLFVKWPSDKKQWSSFSRSLPTCPWTSAVAEASFEPQAVHNGAVERESTLEVCDAYEDVRKHYRLPWVEYRRLTFDLSGEPKACPLEGRVSRH